MITFNNVIGKVTAPIERVAGILGLGNSTIRGYQTMGRDYNRYPQTDSNSGRRLCCLRTSQLSRRLASLCLTLPKASPYTTSYHFCLSLETY